MCAYMIIIGDTLSSVLRAANVDDTLADRHTVILIAAFVFILPLSLLKNMASLSFSSFFSIIAVIAMTLAVTIHAPAVEVADNSTRSDEFVFIKSTFFGGVGGIFFGITFRFACRICLFAPVVRIVS